MQLLQITTNPLKYELEIEHAKLEYKQDLAPSADVQTTSAKLRVDKMENTKVNIDTYNARKSLGVMNTGDFIKKSKGEAEQHIKDQTREYVEIGKELSNIQDGVTVSDVFKSKMLEQPSVLYTAYLPSVGADLSWSPAQLQMSYEPATTETNWQINKNEFNFVPGSIKVKVSELASVDIQYLGGPMYVPPSADPEYEETTQA